VASLPNGPPICEHCTAPLAISLKGATRKMTTQELFDCSIVEEVLAEFGTF
jgi:hypothetical protein